MSGRATRLGHFTREEYVYLGADGSIVGTMVFTAAAGTRDVGKKKTVWYYASGATDRPPEPGQMASQGLIAGLFGVAGLIAIGALIRRALGRGRPARTALPPPSP